MVEGGPPPRRRRRPRQRPGGRGRGAAVATPDSVTWADQEREARARYLHPDVDAASLVELDGDDVRRLAAAGITSALAVPAQGIIRGQSALVNLTAPPDPARDQRSRDLSSRRGRGAVAGARSTWSSPPAGAGGGGGGGYPGALLGVIAFARQSFSTRSGRRRPGPSPTATRSAAFGGFEPALDALAPALERKVPVAFEASEQREILRALAFAKEFNLDPIIVGGAEAGSVIDDLKAAKAAVIVSANFQAAGTRRRSWRRRRRARRRRRRHAGAHHAHASECREGAGCAREGGNSLRLHRRRPAEPGGVRPQRGPHGEGRRAGGGFGAEGVDDRMPRSSPVPPSASARSRRARWPTSSSPKATCSTPRRIRHVFVAGWPVDIEPPRLRRRLAAVEGRIREIRQLPTSNSRLPKDSRSIG